MLRSPRNARICFATLGGYFFHAQFFSAIALLIRLFVAKGPAQGVLFLENAVLVVVAQSPRSAMCES